MTHEEFNEINWHRGNVAKLNNGKEYLVKGVKGHGRYLLLYSEEYDQSFVADHRIVECRTSDYEEPEEVYLEMKRQKQAEAEAKREEERQERLREKAERKQKNIEEQERIHREAVARKAAIKLAKEQARMKYAESEQAQQKATATTKAEPAKEQKPKKPVESTKKPVVAPKEVKKVNTIKEVAPAPTPAPASTPDAPRKRVRQRIRISSATPQKVEFNKKK